MQRLLSFASLRTLGLASLFLGLTGSLTACGDKPLPDNEGGGGAGAGGGTTTDTATDTSSTTTTDTMAQGGSGGGGSDAGGGGAGTGGGGVGGGISEAVCEKICLFGTCDGNVCDNPEILFAFGYQGLGAAGVQVQEYDPSAYQVDVVATNGVCHVVQYTTVKGPTPQPFDAGDPSIDGPTVGLLPLVPEVGSDVIQEMLPADGLFTAGDSVTFAATGGADYAAFSISATAPLPLSLQTPATMTAGQPVSISWTPGPAPDQIQIIGTNSNFMFCFPELDDTLVVPGSLTALLGDSSGSASVNGLRFVTAKQDVGMNGAKVALALESIDAEVVNFFP